MKTKFTYNDGGREEAGFKGSANDCVCRSIAIATGKPYLEIYNFINQMAQNERTGKRKKGKSSARNGVYKQTHRKVMKYLGWKWVPTMQVGSGCRIHLHPNELPKGRLVVSVSKHITAMIDGVIHDTHTPCRPVITTYQNQPLRSNQWIEDANFSPNLKLLWTEVRCVYGYYINSNSKLKNHEKCSKAIHKTVRSR